MKQLIVSLNTTTISSRLLDAKSPSIKLMRSMEIFAQHPFLVQSVVGVTKPVWFKTHVSGRNGKPAGYARRAWRSAVSHISPADKRSRGLGEKHATRPAPGQANWKRPEPVDRG